MHSLAELVLARVRRQELLRAGDRVGIAVSGGIDSVALLWLLLELRPELGIVLSVVHFNHKLRGAESDSDQEFVAGLALEHGLEFYCQSGDVAGLAAEEHSGVEAAARELRYGFFRRLLGAGGDDDDEVPSELLTGPSTSGAEAQNLVPPYRSAGSAAPPQSTTPQGLKPSSLAEPIGPAEAVPFQSQDQERSLNKIATGHTLDDQAETVLMRLIRGTGLRGLGGIHPRIVVENEDGEGQGEIVRPLLGIRRTELEQYLADLKQPWREDSTNAESKFTRNRVRGLVLPLLEREFNPAVVESFAELAEIARDEEDYWENEISGWLGTVVQWSQPQWTRGLPGFEGPQSLVQIHPSNPELLNRLQQPGSAVMNASVSRPWLLTEPIAVQRRVLKAIGEQAGIPLEFKHIEEILHFAAADGPPGKELSLPLGWKIVREPEAMVFITPDLRRQERVPDYEYSLPVPGRAMVPELGVVIEAVRLTPESLLAEYNPQQLLRAELLPRHLIVRNWRPGDRFWPAHTKAPKKIKELLQERHVAQPGRRLWPVAANRDEIVWMRDFSVPAGLRPKAGEEAVLIREIPWEAQERATVT
ncbi:MAG TPA: tRNA lysidine(34) synthetase TilS [Candidatus Eremiobacteraceae bacterium]|nr:tRNA lysidine(34) synthetase TilS [Candidatus Eremiobacteraceae bacterium]